MNQICMKRFAAHIIDGLWVVVARNLYHFSGSPNHFSHPKKVRVVLYSVNDRQEESFKKRFAHMAA
jgi:hypothetical protein